MSARVTVAQALIRFLAAQQICDWIDKTFHVTYTSRGVRDLLHRIGVSYHKTTGFFWKANPAKQEGFLHRDLRLFLGEVPRNLI